MTSTKKHFEEFREALNSVWESVNFTFEPLGHEKLNFLDLTLEIQGNGEIIFTHFQMPTVFRR